MRRGRIEEAKRAAKKFLELAEQARYSAPGMQEVGTMEPVNGPKHSGALRRASMDLTRALAEMRKY